LSFSRSIICFIAFCGPIARLLAQTGGATFGEVVTLGGTPGDIVLDESRGRLYLVNTAANRIDAYSYLDNRLLGSVAVGQFPLSAAMSMDNAWLYVTNRDSSSLSVIDLGSFIVTQTVRLPAAPEGVAVGLDGRALITTQGTGVNNATNTLLIYDRQQELGAQLYPVPFPPALTTPTPLPPLIAGRPATPFPGRLMRTPDGRFIVGMVALNQNTNQAQTTMFVYEVAGGAVLVNRTVTGNSSVLSVAPDGASFMAGSTLYRTGTLQVRAQMNTANLPFFIGTGFNPAFNIQANFGGSVFSPDGETIYGAFNTAATNQRPVANVLYIANARNLGVRLGIRLPESILGKMVITPDGQTIFAASESGLLRLPVGRLYDYPILQPETTQVFLTVDECNKGLAKAKVRILNLGSGKLTFSVPTVTTALVTQVKSGVTPSEIEFIMEPGRSGVLRQPGTNLFTNAAFGGGAPINITLSSVEAINYPNTIRVYMNYRNPDQRGIIHPRPVSLNNAQGLQEVVLDEKRSRLYISNAGYNRIEVFDIQRQKFIDPIEVVQLPRAMAMSLDGNLLYVGSSSSETIAVVDLDLGKVVGEVDFPPIPRAGNQNSLAPVAMAYALTGLQFVMSNGGFWRVIGNQAVPRLPNNVTPGSIPGPQYMIATPGGEYILTLAGNGVAYLYDALADTYTASRQLYDQAPISYFGPLAAAPYGRFFVVSSMTLSTALSLIGGAERPGQTQFGPPPGPGQPPTQTLVSAGLRNVAAAYANSENTFFRFTTPVRQNAQTQTRDEVRPTVELVDVRNDAPAVLAVAPENPVNSVFGATRVNVPARQMAVDSAGTAYVITLSGLSVIPLALPGSPGRPQISGGVRGIINAVDGSSNLRPGAFIAIQGANLALPAKAEDLPVPTVLGGACVTFNDVAIPLLETSPGRILGQIPAEIRPGQNIVQVRSLATAQSSDPLVITLQPNR
jgi:YVTN family beta-propeller protein